MNEKPRKQLLLIILVAAIIWAGFNLGPSSDPQSVPSAETILPLNLNGMDAKIHPPIDTLSLSKKSWGKDPFRYRGVNKQSPVPAQIWVVTGIMYRKNSSIAYVNSRSVKVGDLVDDAKVIRINKKQVTLEFSGDRFTIALTRG